MQECAAGGAVAGAHGAAVGLDDRFADGKTDAHVAALVGDGLLVAGEVAVEQVREQGGGDPLPVVGDLEDGEIFADEISYVKENKQEVGIEIHSGRNRIVRRIFEFLGYTVTKLDRVYYAGLTKKNLKRGAWRFLTREEVERLKSGQYE